ncbi:MAG: secondary thiamine-phosphate synthase enzyme YjbQ [Anaerolineae bacterium]|jgi:secondary thiamine-phosphate synthase enzyme|nr:secondary thiamine-phosphate synthase enzyme YjbQ [Anaerolineae bacterium]
MFKQIEIQTRTKVDLLDITADIQRAITEMPVQEGVCFLFCPHTTAGIVLNENWDPTVERDLAMVLEHMVPEGLPYTHGEGNSPAHVKSVLLGSDHFIIITQHQLQLGQWQGVFFAELDGPRRRHIWIRVIRAGE